MGLTRLQIARKAVDEGNDIIAQIVREQINETVLTLIQSKLDAITKRYLETYGVDPNLKLNKDDDIISFLRATVGEGVSWRKGE